MSEGLKLSTGGNGAPSNMIAPNAFIDEFTILSAKDVSKIPMPWGVAYDFGLELEIKIDNLEFPLKFTLKGDYERNAEGAVIGWGKAWFCEAFLKEAGVFKGKEQVVIDEILTMLTVSKIPQTILTGLVGQKFYRISYATGLKDNGKLEYKSFNTLMKDKDKLTAYFLKGVEKGFPNNYDPLVKPEGTEQTSFNFGANVVGPNHPNAEAFNNSMP